MNAPLSLNRVTVMAVVCVAALLVACKKSPEVARTATATQPAPAAQATPVADPMVVRLSPEMAQRIQVGQPRDMEVSDALNVAGRVDVDEHRLERIGSNVTGRVVDVLVHTGDSVSPGKPLARISSPELTNAQLSYLRAASAATLAEKAVERARLLLNADVIGSAEQQRREAEFQVAKAELNAAADQLKMLGMHQGSIIQLRNAGDIQTAVPVTAQRGGVVIERKVNVGQVVQPADQMFALADLSSVWIVGGVPEQAARMVAVNQQVDVVVPAINKTLAGRIVYVSDTVSPDTRTVTVRTEVNNTDRGLKPAMLATLRIKGLSARMLTVPSAAVVRENDRDHVFVMQTNGVFQLTPVQLGPEVTGEVRPVLRGLVAEQRIAIDGAFHLNNERKRAELE